MVQAGLVTVKAELFEEDLAAPSPASGTLDAGHPLLPLSGVKVEEPTPEDGAQSSPSSSDGEERGVAGWDAEARRGGEFSKPRLRSSGGRPSKTARALAERIRSGREGPVLSLRTTLQNCKAPDVEAVFEAMLECDTIHMMSIGRNDALAKSFALVDLLLRVMRLGFVWACDWGELCFHPDVMDHLVDGLQDDDGSPCTNLAFVFADVGCGVSRENEARLKDLTRHRRLLDKELAPKEVGRTHGPWLDAEKVFGFVMRSENLTRCFWRPYQEAAFWRNAGFPCPTVDKPANALKKWVNPAIQPLCLGFHRGDLDAYSVCEAFPPGKRGDKHSRELLTQCLRGTALPRSLATANENEEPMNSAPRKPVAKAKATAAVSAAAKAAALAKSQQAGLRAGVAQDARALAMAEKLYADRHGQFHVELWLGCEACPGWFVVDSGTYAYWQGRSFVCRDLSRRCGDSISTTHPSGDQHFACAKVEPLEEQPGELSAAAKPASRGRERPPPRTPPRKKGKGKRRREPTKPAGAEPHDPRAGEAVLGTPPETGGTAQEGLGDSAGALSVEEPGGRRLLKRRRSSSRALPASGWPCVPEAPGMLQSLGLEEPSERASPTLALSSIKKPKACRKVAQKVASASSGSVSAADGCASPRSGAIPPPKVGTMQVGASFPKAAGHCSSDGVSGMMLWMHSSGLFKR